MPAVLLRYAAYATGLLPLVWLLVGRRKVDPAYWWMAGAFAVSFAADALGAFLPVRPTADVYPLLQSALIGLVLLDRKEALLFFGLLVLAAIIAPIVSHLRAPDLVLSTVAWLGVTWIAYQYQSLPALVRWSLLVYFGLGWVWWVLYVAVRGHYMQDGHWTGGLLATWGPWLGYQSVRLIGSVLFCLAVRKPGPSLRVVR